MWWYIILLIILHNVSGQRDDRIELHIGGIFPMTSKIGGWAGGASCLPAALMALDDINNRHDVIPGYKLVMHGHKNDSKCEPGLAAKIMYELIYNEPTKLILLSGCSTETTIVAEAAETWNLLVMGYGASSPALSDKERFPTLFRTHPSATIHNPARLAIFRRFNWHRVGVIHSNDEVFSSTADDLQKQLSQAGAVLVARQNFGNPADAVTNLKREDARIIVGMYYAKHARQVLCEAHKKRLFGPRYVWFLIGWYQDKWYLPQSGEEEEHLDCTEEEMRQAAQYHFTTEGLMKSNKQTPGIAKMTYLQFEKELLQANVTSEADGFQEAPLAYDAIWAIALAFNCTIRKMKESGSGMRLENFNYNDTETRKMLEDCMKELDFDGVSGPVKFSDKGDRITLTQIEQLQGDSYMTVGNYNETKKEINWTDADVIFPGGKVPKDQTEVIEEWKSVSVDVYGTMTFFAGVGIAAAIICIGFNYGFCYRKLIYLSQYQVNNLMLAGCVVCFVAIFITGLPMQTSPKYRDTFSALCHARVTLMMYGFTLVYGALFSKVWIVHRMGSTESRDQAVQPWKFYAVVGVLASIDTVIALLWVVIDPLQRSEEDLQDIDSSAGHTSVGDADWRDVKIDAKLEHCTSKYQQVWIGLVYTYKGILLLFGLFLAYEIRNAKAKYINDSRFVSMAIYNVAVLCLITGPVALIIRSQPDANFGFTACTILLCTFISMGLIFVPKVIHVVRIPTSAEHKASSGPGCSGSIDTALTKEEQERLKRLMKENEDIQQQIAEKDMRIMELRRRLEYRIAQKQQQETSSSGAEAEITHHKASVGSQKFPNGKLNKSLLIPHTSVSTDGVVVASKRSPSTIAPMPQFTSTVIHAPKTGITGAVPTEPEPMATAQSSRCHDPDDSGYRSSINGRQAGFLIEPADTDVLL